MKQMTYRRSLLLTVLILLVSTICFAQQGKAARVHALKVSYITDKLNLSSAQAERFWPVYNRYEDELRDLRQKFRRETGGKNKAKSPEEAHRMIEDNLDFQEDVIALKRRYKDEFLRVISAQQLADLYTAEREFKQMLIKRLEGRNKRR
jgi:hypothetical protein